MKNNFYTLIAGLLISTIGFSQGSIPNGNFESWTTGTYDIPQNYVECSDPQTFYENLPNNEIKSTDFYHGAYAVQLTTTVSATKDTLMAYFINTNPNQGGNKNGPPAWYGGFAYNQKPTGIRGYYKSSIASPDTGRILVMFKHSGVDTSIYLYSFYGTHSTYTMFSYTFNPPLPSTPDTVIFAAGSSDFTNNNLQRNGSMLQIDSVSFTGVSSQPALFNGDFENWTTQNMIRLDNWLVNPWEAQGVMQTTDKVAGNYAVELKTFLGDRNGNPAAQSAQINNGGMNCPLPPPAPCIAYGGYPFSNQFDTLCFWYKYIPMGMDTAQINVNFRNTTQQWNNGILLNSSSVYKYVEIPYNLPFVPDTVSINAQSSSWQDSAVSFVGSDLKLDEMHFKSQPLTTSVPSLHIDNTISVYPNPSSWEFTIQSSLFNVENVEVYNAVGEKIISEKPNAKTEVLNLKEEGIYFVRMNSNGKIITKKLIVNK
ncbi:MAG: T9SS type A sorting domain-containing protein [Bacteroidetes bacterium]|nr:T9SS type A sorting domain-containing protein [Bacteroidota bacterium]